MHSGAGSAHTFGLLLRAYRMDAGFTQEQLAERCGLSRRGIADLERGARHVPQASTLERLAAGLGLSDVQREELLNAAHRNGRNQAEVPVSPVDPPGRDFVGRHPELTTLRTAAERVLKGNGLCAFIAGEPGIGKTALCEQFANHTRSRGIRTLVGRCYEDPSLSPPYAPFVEALSTYVRGLATDELRAQLGQKAADVARLLPELSERLRIQPSEPDRGQDERWRLLSAVSDFLRAAAAARPIVLILEDLHWADLGTLDLLRYLMRHLEAARLLVIGTYRNAEVQRDQPLGNVLAEFRRRPESARIELGGLTDQEVQLVSEQILGHTISKSSAQILQRFTEGNPLFLDEIVRYMMEEGLSSRLQASMPDDVLVPRLPVGIREMIGRRLSGLSGTCQQVLAVASIFGREFELDTLRQVVSVPEDQVLNALEEAQRARVVEDISQLRDVRFRFAHALFRETLYLDLFTPRRLALHQRVALALESRFADELEQHAAELTEHFQRSGDPRDIDKALRYAELAANRALRVSAYGEAARHLRTALALQSSVDSSALEKRCDLWLTLGQAMIGAGQLEAVPREVAPEVLKLAELLGDQGRACQACLLAGEALLARSGVTSSGSPEFKYWVDQHQRHAGSDPVRQSLLLTAQAMASAGSGDEQRARASSRRAVEFARQSPARGIFHIVSRYDIEPWMWGAADQRQRLAVAEELLDSINQSLLGRTSGAHFHNTLHFMQFEVGDVLLTWGQRERAEGLWTSDLKERLEYPWSGLIAERVQLILSCLDGELERISDLAAAHVHTAELLGATPFGQENAAVYLRRPRLYVGLADEALAEFHPELRDVAAADMPVSGLWGMYAAQRGVCLAHARRSGDAQAVLDRFLSARHPLDASNALPLPTAVALLEVATCVGDRSAAASLAQALDPAADLVAADGTLTVIARHLAAAYELNDQHDLARTYAKQALFIAEKVRFRPEVALARLQLAEVELQLANLPVAIELLDKAKPELEAMHMRPALEYASTLHSQVMTAIR